MTLMRVPPQIRILPDGRRLHLQHGPIDLIVEATGDPASRLVAYEAAGRRFATILDELCGELTLLRSSARPAGPRPEGAVARRMAEAVAPFAGETFITPMAAVAGSVAEEVLAAMLAAAPLARAYVNNGGDIALHLAPGAEFRVGLIDRPDRPGLFGTTTIRAGDTVRGIATSGWRGRSFSLGIADAVTILADSAAAADAAASIVANAVDLPGHRAILRVPAREIQPDSDLGDRPVTRDVGELADPDIDLALARGVAAAHDLARRGLIVGAALNLQGRTKVAGMGSGPISRAERDRVRGMPSTRPVNPTPHPSPAREREPRRAAIASFSLGTCA